MDQIQRLHAMDAVRAFALLSGIVLHASLSFLPGFGATGIPLVDVSPSATLAVFFFVIHSFRMSLFFFIAGFFAHLAFHRRGWRPFLIDRGKRIGLTLIVGWFLLFPPILVAIVWAAMQTPGYQPPAPPPASRGLEFPLTHLWFLYVLLWLYVIVLAVRGVFIRFIDRSGYCRMWIDGRMFEIVASPLGPLLLAIPAVLSLFSDPEWVLWFGVPTPDRSLLPNYPALTAYLTSFCVGWFLHRQPGLLEQLEQRWRQNLTLAILCTVASLAIVGPLPRFVVDAKNRETLLYALCYVLSAWYWSFAILGIGMKYFSNPNPRLRYLADASYWMYLVHLPLIFLMQALVLRWPLHWSVKFPLILLVSLTVMLLSYQYLVRSTFIGGWLSGRRYPKESASGGDLGIHQSAENHSARAVL